MGATKREPPKIEVIGEIETSKEKHQGRIVYEDMVTGEPYCTCELYGVAGCWTCTNLNDERTR